MKDYTGRDNILLFGKSISEHREENNLQAISNVDNNKAKLQDYIDSMVAGIDCPIERNIIFMIEIQGNLKEIENNLIVLRDELSQII